MLDHRLRNEVTHGHSAAHSLQQRVQRLRLAKVSQLGLSGHGGELANHREAVALEGHARPIVGPSNGL